MIVSRCMKAAEVAVVLFCAAIARLRVPPKEVAERLGVPEETLSRWVDEFEIQSRAMDNLMRILFAFPNVRACSTRLRARSLAQPMKSAKVAEWASHLLHNQHGRSVDISAVQSSEGFVRAIEWKRLGFDPQRNLSGQSA